MFLMQGNVKHSSSCAASGRDTVQLILPTEGKHFAFKPANLRKGLEGCNQMKAKPCRVRADSSISVAV